MTVVILDSGVAAGAALRDEPWHEHAQALLRDIANRRLDALVATTFGFELRTTLLKAVRRGRLSWETLGDVLHRVEGLRLVMAATNLDDGEVLEACRQYSISWADCHPVLLARRLRVPLITSDERLVRALHGSDVWVESILDRPLDVGQD